MAQLRFSHRRLKTSPRLPLVLKKEASTIRKVSISIADIFSVFSRVRLSFQPAYEKTCALLFPFKFKKWGLLFLCFAVPAGIDIVYPTIQASVNSKLVLFYLCVQAMIKAFLFCAVSIIIYQILNTRRFQIIRHFKSKQRLIWQYMRFFCVFFVVGGFIYYWMLDLMVRYVVPNRPPIALLFNKFILFNAMFAVLLVMNNLFGLGPLISGVLYTKEKKKPAGVYRGLAYVIYRPLRVFLYAVLFSGLFYFSQKILDFLVEFISRKPLYWIANQFYYPLYNIHPHHAKSVALTVHHLLNLALDFWWMVPLLTFWYYFSLELIKNESK